MRSGSRRSGIDRRFRLWPGRFGSSVGLGCRPWLCCRLGWRCQLLASHRKALADAGIELGALALQRIEQLALPGAYPVERLAALASLDHIEDVLAPLLPAL